MTTISYNVYENGKLSTKIDKLERGEAYEALFVARGLGTLADACNLTGSQLCERLGLSLPSYEIAIDEARLLKAIPGNGKTRGIEAIARHYCGKETSRRNAYVYEQPIERAVRRLAKEGKIVETHNALWRTCFTLNDQHAHAERQARRARAERERAEEKACQEREASITARLDALAIDHKLGFRDVTLTHDQIEALLTLAEKGRAV